MLYAALGGIKMDFSQSMANIGASDDNQSQDRDRTRIAGYLKID